MCLLLEILFTVGLQAAPSPKCIKWFSESKISTNDRDCSLKCGTLGTGMDSFMCPQACNELCKPRPEDDDYSKALGRYLYYPGLTLEERRLVSKYPREAIKVFSQKQAAESATMRTFNRDAQNDESDAFRHFVWAGLLTKELGSDLAKQFLDAHEGDGRTNDPSRAMDLANNRAGLITAEKLLREGTLTESTLEKSALDAIAAKTLIVLEPRDRGSK